MGACFGVFDVLRDTQNPLFSFLSEVILDLQELMDHIDNRLDSIALVDPRSLIQNQIGHLFRQHLIILAQVFDDVEVLGLEVDHLGHECVVLHALVLHVVQFVALFDQEGHKLQGVLELGCVVVVAHRVFLLGAGEWRVVLQDEIQDLLHHHPLLAVTTHETVLLDQSQPYVEILLESVPVLCDLVAHHLREFLQKL